VAAGRLLFVSGQDPERDGRLVYRGRVGVEVDPAGARAAVRLAGLNALAAAAATVGSLEPIRRCVAVTCFVDAAPGALSHSVCDGLLALLRRTLGPAPDPIVWLRPARGLAGLMPVEVELLLELD
jgi:enamine deaminase RidA (YjgF/YER057c/UK114 family)